MFDDPQNNWNNLLQKLNTRVPDQEPKSTEEANASLSIPGQINNINLSNGSSPDVKTILNQINANEDFNILNKLGNAQSAAVFNYVDDISDLQINQVINNSTTEKNGRTFALNGRFICFVDENNVLITKSLKNLSLTHTFHDFESKIIDLSFFEEGLTNSVAIMCANGTVSVYTIDLNQSKDKILVKIVLKQNLERTIEKGQIEWKDPKKLGLALEDELIIFNVLSEQSLQEPTEEPPKPFSQNSNKFEHPIKDFAFSPEYALVYVLFEDNTVRLINLENGDKIKDFTPHNVESSGPVVKLLAYKSLMKHELIKTGEGEADKNYENTPRDIFITVTQSFEIKVWDSSEWDESNETYFCIETFQLSQINDKLDPISLIKRFVFFDPNLTFLFVAFKANGDKGVNVNALHIDRFYYGYSDMYNTGKKSKKFFNSVQNVWFKKTDLTDLYVLNFGDDEIDSYFKKNSYLPETDFEPASTRTQEGSYGGSSKSILSFFVHNESNISIFKVWGEKLYPFSLVEEFDKISQAEQLDSQLLPTAKLEGNDGSFPPEIPNFVKDFINENKKQQTRKDDDKLVKVIAESEYSRSDAKTNAKKSDNSAREDGGDAGRNTQKDAVTKEDTNSPDVPKAHVSHKKKGGNEHKKDREATNEQHDHNKSKAPTKIVTRENQKNAPSQSSNLKSVEMIEKEAQNSKREEAQVQLLEKTIEKRFQDLTEKSLQTLNAKFLKIEETIENRINEKVSKLHTDSVTSTLSKDIDEKFQREFSNAFERTVTPCFEKYLVKMFEQVCASFEKGHKFYIDKLNIEQAKSAQLKETMNEVIKSFVQISNTLTEGLVNNQNNYSRMEINIQDKQNQIGRLVDQMSEIIQRQQDIQRKMENVEKNMHDASYQYSSELHNFRDAANRYLGKFGEPSLQGYSGGHGGGRVHQEESKRDFHDPTLLNPYIASAQLYNQDKSAKEKTSHALNDQLAYLQAIMAGKPMDLSGNLNSRAQPTSPRSAQLTNPLYQQQFDAYNPYQRSKTPNIAINTGFPNTNTQSNLNQQGGINPLLVAQQLPSQGHVPSYNPSQQKTASQNQGNQMPAELQDLYQKIDLFFKQQQQQQQQNKEKDEEKDRSFTRSVHENSPYGQNSGHQEGNRKLFDLAQIGQIQHGNEPSNLSTQRSLSQIENQQTPKLVPRTSTHQDLDAVVSKTNSQLPPGMQNTNQPQTNFVQALLQNLPQNLQQNFTQNQGLPQQKISSNFLQNLISHNGSGAQNQGQQNNNQMGQNIQDYPSIYVPGMLPAQGQNYTNFGGFYIPPQMTNPRVNKMTSNQPNNNAPSNSVDINQIPLVNSIFKTPSRDAAEENSNTSGTNNNIN